jgi:hypothetical protein
MAAMRDCPAALRGAAAIRPHPDKRAPGLPRANAAGPSTLVGTLIAHRRLSMTRGTKGQASERESQGFAPQPQEAAASPTEDALEQKVRAASEEARSVVDRGREKLAGRADGVAQAMRHASQGLRADEQAELARYASVVADKLEQLTGALKNRDLGSIASELTRFAQRQPALFLGGAFTTGLLAARFLKSSGRPLRRDAEE